MRQLPILAVLLAASLALQAGAQCGPPNAPAQEQLANDPKLLLEVAAKKMKWNEPAEPVRIVGPLYFVGTQGLSSWLFATSEGHILLNTGTQQSGPMIVESIRALGFKPEELRDYARKAGLDVLACQRATQERRPPHFEVLTLLARKP